MSAQFKIADRYVGDGHPAFVIAEASTNHNGDLARAKDMVVAAKEAGADCIKFQTYTPSECLTPGKNFTYQSQGETITESEYEMFVRLAFDREQWAELVDYCEAQEILFLTTVQDSVDLELMLSLGLKGIKKGSDDFDYVPSLVEAARTGLPLILSKGMATLGDVDNIVRTLAVETKTLAILHCVSLYPTDPAKLNIRQIPMLKRLYPDVVWGFSDHSIGTLASTIAVAMGASIIEKHFTLDHDLPGPDHWFSMDVAQLDQLVRDIRFAESSLGTGDISPDPDELESRSIMRRRVVAKEHLSAGAVLSDQNVRFKRAAEGAFLDQWPLIDGARLNKDKGQDVGIDFRDIG